MDKITRLLENVVRCKDFEAGVHIKNPMKNSYQDGLGRTTQTLDHVVVVHILIWDKRKSQINKYSDPSEYEVSLSLLSVRSLNLTTSTHTTKHGWMQRSRPYSLLTICESSTWPLTPIFGLSWFPYHIRSIERGCRHPVSFQCSRISTNRCPATRLCVVSTKLWWPINTNRIGNWTSLDLVMIIKNAWSIGISYRYVDPRSGWSLHL